MKNFKTFSLLALLGIALSHSACKKDTPPPPIASFTYTEDDNRTVHFVNTSENAPNKLEWDFGDGQSGTGDTISHTYASDSAYTVTLKATNDHGANSSMQIVNVAKKLQLISIQTSFGEMIMWLYDQTPKHKANFLKLTGENFYDSTTFHRIIQNFVIQGGDPNSKDNDPSNDGYGGPGYTIDAEIKSNIRHDYGAVGAARDNNPQKASNGSQFYIVVNKAGDHNLDGLYTVFGMIIKGMDVAEKIAIQPKDGNDRPLTDIRMDVNIIKKSKAEIKTEFGYDIP